MGILRSLLPSALAAAVVAMASAGCGACATAHDDSGTPPGDAGTDAGGFVCTAIDQCGDGFTCEFGACVPCPPSGCPEFTSIPLPETGVVWWTFASGGSLAEASTSVDYEVIGVFGHGAAIPTGDENFAQTSPTHTHYGGFASALTAP